MDYEHTNKVINAYKAFFRDGDGALILEDLKTYCRYDRSTFDAHNPYNTAFFEGKREVFLKILEMRDRPLIDNPNLGEFDDQRYFDQ